MPESPRLPALPIPQSYETVSKAYKQILVSHHPSTSSTPTPVIIVTLNRPAKYNAFTDVMMRELEQIFDLLDRDDRVKCVVITGAGKMYCAGADLDIGFLGQGKGREKDADEGAEDRHRDGGGRTSLAIHHCRKPTIAAINGAAIGVGITMVLPCTIRVATSTAKIGFVFARRGIVMEACSSYFLPKLIGMSRALHVCTTGAVLPASSPLLSGLFSELCDTPEATLNRALELADDIAQNTSTVSTAIMRDLMYRATDSAEAQHLLDSKIIYGLFGSKDNNEGVQSFMEKRKANFSGIVSQDGPKGWPWWNQGENDIDSPNPKPKM